jgi:predicted MPP superfamily phosphohydrolase
MRILHITDFHYRNETKFQHDQNSIVDALVNHLKTKDPVDLVFFTGDLVFSGKDPSDFIRAKELLLDRLCSDLNVSKDHVIICPGNHDVFREQELIDTTEIIKKIDTNSDLEEYIKRQGGKSFAESMKNHLHFNSFRDNLFQEYNNSPSSINDLYTVHKIVSGSHQLAIVSINTAWRAIDSEWDRGNLLFPISTLKKAIEDSKQDATIRILLMHHPLTDFKAWNGSDMEDVINKEFLLAFSGHLHKRKQSIMMHSNEGIFCCSTAATLAFDGSINGYCLINVDLDTYDIGIENCFYNHSEGTFHDQAIIKTCIPVNEVKKESNEFKKTLRKRYNEELERANELFISYDDKEKGKGFTDLFTDPILKSKTKAQLAESKSDVAPTPLATIIPSSENIVIYGKDKSGKTSILYKVLLDSISDFSASRIIPIYLDSKIYRGSSKKVLNIEKHIAAYFEINNTKSKELPKKYRIKLLIDNYNPNLSDFNGVVNEYLKANPEVYFIAATEEKVATSFTSYEFDGREYNNLYIHDISRPEVRSLASKWPNLTPEKREIIMDKIFTIFSQLNIPYNYWSVSLFIWLFEKNNDANFHNSFELIQLYIDNLLDRKRLAINKSSKLTFEEFKSYLASLAYFLMYDRAEKGYTATYSEIVDFTNRYRNDNKKFVIEVKDIIDLIIEKNILRRVYDDTFTFRLNGVFEYFLALYMTIDETFRNKVISDEHYYLSFKNELELLAGFQKDQELFIDKIYQKTKEIFGETEAIYSNVDIDTQLKLKISKVFDAKIPMDKLGKEYKKALTVEKQDELMKEMQPARTDESGVKVKDYYEKIENTSENLETALHILARVYRNSNLRDERKLNEILDYILNSACYFGFKLIDEADKGEIELGGLKNQDISEDHEKLIVQLLTNFMPLIVQTFFYDAVGQNDLERIFKEKIVELKKDTKNNQFKLMILYFTLIDLDVSANRNLIEEVIETINLGILKQTTVIKLHIYLMFKCANKPQLEQFLNTQIQKQSGKINPKIDKVDLQKTLEKDSKLAKYKNKKK